MFDLSAWFSPTFLDLVWYQLFGHFFGYSRRETEAWFARQRSKDNSLDDLNELLYKEGDEFK